jgi:hypothetical protein
MALGMIQLLLLPQQQKLYLAQTTPDPNNHGPNHRAIHHIRRVQKP